MSNLSESLRDLESNAARLLEENVRLKRENETLKNSATQRTHANELRQMRIDHKAEIDAVVASHAAISKRNSAERDAARSEAKDACTEKERVLLELRTAHASNDKSRDEINALKIESNKLRKTISDSVLSPAEAQVQVKRLKAAADLAKREAEDANQKAFRLSQDLTAARKAREADNAELQVQLSELRATVGRQTRNQNALLAEVEGLRIERNNLRSTVRPAEKSDEVRKLQAQLRAANAHIETLTSAKDNRDNRNTMAQMRADTAAHRLTELQASVNRISSELSETRNQNKSLTSQVANLVGQMQAAQRAMQQKEVENEGLRIKLDVATGAK